MGADNPTLYREPSVYRALLDSVSHPSPDGEGVEGYDLLQVQSIQTYIKVGCAMQYGIFTVVIQYKNILFVANIKVQLEHFS